MIFRVLAAVALLCAVSPAFAQKTKAQLNSEISAQFPDNTVNAITPQNLRTVTDDMVNSTMPTAPVTSGNLSVWDGTTGLTKDGGPIPGAGAVIYAVNYGVKCDNSTDDTVDAQAAITAANGRPVVFPAGTCIITSTLSYTTNASSFSQGGQIIGQGREKTIFDFRGANSCLFNFQTTSNGQFQSGINFQEFKIISTTSPTLACGIEIYRASYAKFENIQMTGLTGNGIYIPASAGDADASFEIVLDRIRMDNVGTGGAWCAQFSAPSGGYFGSNLRITNSTFSGCGAASAAVPPTTGAIDYKGLIAQFENDGFTINNNVDLYIQGPDTSLQVSIDGTDFENVISTVLPHIYVDGGLRGFHMVNSECLNNDSFVGQGCVWFNSNSAPIGNVTLDKVEVRATTNNNTYTAFKVSGSNTLVDTIRATNIYWQTFDLSGQTRFSGFTFPQVVGEARLAVASLNSVVLTPIGTGASMPLKSAATGEWGNIQLTSGVTQSLGGSLSASTLYNIYLANSAAANAVPVPILEASTTAPTLDQGYNVKTGDSTRTFVGTILTDGSGNFQTTVGKTISWYNPIVGSAGQFVGTASADSASAGNLGEYVFANDGNGGTPATVTITIAAPAVVSWTGHGITGPAAVTFTTSGALPTGITAGTTYYAVPINANSFYISTTIANAIAGTYITTTGTQSGTQTGIPNANLTNATPVDVAGVSLTAGDWDLYGFAYLIPASSTTLTAVISSISQTANTLDLMTLGAAYVNRTATFTGAGLATGGFTTGPVRVSLSGTTTIHLVVQGTFGTSTATGYGGIRARRVR